MVTTILRAVSNHSSIAACCLCDEHSHTSSEEPIVMELLYIPLYYLTPCRLFPTLLHTYCVLPQPNEEDARGSAVMRLWRFFPPVEHRLRAAKYDLNGFEWHSDRDEDECVAELMHGCDIYWSRAPSSETDLSLDGGDEENEAREGLRFEGTVLPFVGLMGNDDEGTWISSQLVEGMSILVKDNLKVWPDRLWINDRGFDGEGNFVYGNQRGVPYKMRRATPGGPLGWTLGDEYRSSELYAKKMHAIGVMPE